MSARRSRRNPDRLPPNTPLGRYWLRTQRPLNALVFVLPLMIAYELSVAMFDTDLLARIQLWRFLSWLGATTPFLPAMLVIVVLLGWHVASGQKWRVNGWTLVGMGGEAVAWALPLLGIGILAQRLMTEGIALTAGAEASASFQAILAGMGAGLYEEFLFRLAGLNLFTLLLLDVMELPKDIGYTVAILLSAVLFGLYHFWGRWNTFTPLGLTFYTIAGVYLAAVYVLRGFGVSVGTHALYNLMAIALRLMAHST